MPRDLFQERGIRVDFPKSNNEPRDLFAEKGINPKQFTPNDIPAASPPQINSQRGSPVDDNNVLPQTYEFLKRVPQDLEAGFVGSVMPQTGNAMMPENPTLQDKLTKGFTEYMPFSEAGRLASWAFRGGSKIPGMISNVLGQTAAGGLYGAVHDPEEGALGITKSALLAGPAAHVIGTIANIPFNFAKNLITNEAWPEIMNKVRGAFQSSKNLNNQMGFALASQNYSKNALKKSEDAWTALKERTTSLDLNPEKYEYNPDQFYHSLEQKKQELENQIEHGNSSKEVMDSIQYINDKLNSKLLNFDDAVEYGRALNSDFGRTYTVGMKVPQQIVKFVMKSFKENAEKNIASNGLEKTLGKEWREANQATKDKYDIFHQIQGSKGGEDESSFIRYFQQKEKGEMPKSSINENEPSIIGTKSNVEYDPSNFVNDYLPREGEKGIQRFQHFEKVIGDRETARRLLLQNIFGDNPEPKKLISEFQKLSEEQKNYLLKKGQRKMLEGVNSIVKRNPKAIENPEFKRDWVDKLIPGLGLIGGLGTGAIASYFSGGFKPLMLGGSVAAGSLLPSTGRVLARNVTKIPGIKARVIDKELGQTGMITHLRKLLTNNMTQKALLPYTVDSEKE